MNRCYFLLLILYEYYTPGGVRSEASSKLPFQAVCYTPIGRIMWCVSLLKNIGRRLPLELDCSFTKPKRVMLINLCEEQTNPVFEEDKI